MISKVVPGQSGHVVCPLWTGWATLDKEGPWVPEDSCKSTIWSQILCPIIIVLQKFPAWKEILLYKWNRIDQENDWKGNNFMLS